MRIDSRLLRDNYLDKHHPDPASRYTIRPSLSATRAQSSIDAKRSDTRVIHSSLRANLISESSPRRRRQPPDDWRR